MGRHSIPGPDDTPREPFRATPRPEPETTPYESEAPFETPEGPPPPEDEYPPAASPMACGRAGIAAPTASAAA